MRTASFAFCFMVVGLVFLDRGASALAWGLLALQFLVYPQLAYLHASTARDQRRAEIANLYFDSLALGAWVAMLGFPTWLAYGALSSTMLNLAIMGSWAGAGRAAACFALGALAWIVPMGFVHYPGTSDLVTALCFFGSLGYGTGVGLVVFGRNEHLRRVRDELREGARRYQLITEHAAELVAMVDRDGRLRYASPSYGRILADEDLAPGADAFRSLHEEDQLRVRGALQALVKSGLSTRLHLRLHTRYGELRRFEVLMHAVRDQSGAVTEAEGAVTAAVLVSRDVTDLREREEQLEVAGLAFERMTEAMMITNAAGRILSVNAAFTRITGYEAGETLGRHESNFRSEMQTAAFYDDLYATVLRTGNWRGSSWCQRRDGTMYREWRSVSAVRGDNERVTHFVTLFSELNGHAVDRGGENPVPGRPARSA